MLFHGETQRRFGGSHKHMDALDDLCCDGMPQLIDTWRYFQVDAAILVIHSETAIVLSFKVDYPYVMCNSPIAIIFPFQKQSLNPHDNYYSIAITAPHSLHALPTIQSI